MDNRWQLHRAGLINFWYYNEHQEFKFADGRLLLRGSNGSGKSVTMQSFIPLLLDGNRSSERLDPFGSRSRRLDNYMLEDGDERTERTGYLYLEFLQPETGLTQTIGMGIRARENMPLDTWYFYLGYTLEIGNNFHLYRNQARTHVLTKGELKKAVGTGGEVYESQRAYMEAVNHYIFGFDAIEEYRELINLLIQLRSPKLSKDFKPTVISEILTQSLQPLSDEDLKPLSESVENMDEIETNLQNLLQAQEALGRLQHSFILYNSAVYNERTSQLLASLASYHSHLEDKQVLSQTMQDTRVAIDDIQQTVEAKELELESANKQLDYLQGSDLLLLRNRLEDREQELIRELAYLDEKADQVAKKEANLRQLENQQLASRQEGDQLDYKLRQVMTDLDLLAEEGGFDEHSFMRDELLRDLDQPYAFVTSQKQLSQYQDQLNKARTLLQQSLEAQAAYERLLAEYDQMGRDQAEYERNIQRWVGASQEAKEEWAIQLRKWNQGTAAYRLSPMLENDLYQLIDQAQEVSDLEASRQVLSRSYQDFRLELEKDKLSLDNELQTAQAAYQDKQVQVTNWQNQEEVEPVRPEAVIKSRQWLVDQGIPHQPLYRALDFSQGLSERVANQIEELLLELGWLDALLIPDQYRDQVLSQPTGQGDQYIFYQDAVQLDQLSDYFSLNHPKEEQQLGLDSLSLDGGGLELDPRLGVYRQGPLTGLITRDYQANYIGYQRRRDHHAQELARLQEELAHLAERVSNLRAQRQKLEEQEAQGEEDYQSLPVLEDITTALNEIRRLQQEEATLQGQIDRLYLQVQSSHSSWQALHQEALEACRVIYLPAQLDRIEEVQEAMGDYQRQVLDLIDYHRQYLATRRQFTSLADQLEEGEEDLDDLRSDWSRYDRHVKQLQQEIIGIRDQLEHSDYADLQDQLQEVLQRSRALPGELLSLREDMARLEERLNYQERSYQEFLSNEGVLETELGTTYQAYKAELSLGYLFQDDQDRQGFLETYQGHWQALQAADSDQEVQLLEAFMDFLDKAEDMLDQDRYLETSASVANLSSRLHNTFVEQKNELTHYVVQLAVRFAGEGGETGYERDELVALLNGEEVSLFSLYDYVASQVETNQLLLQAKDRILFEEVITNTIGRKIRAKIFHSEAWIKEMNDLMTQAESSTSNGFALSLRWKHKRAQREGEMSSKELIDLLKMDASLMTDHHRSRLTLHFRTKIQQAREEMGEGQTTYSFHAALKEILDYRQWFEFQIYFKKAGDPMRELTNNKFFALSGGEKAMAMYIPLFSAVVAKYRSARPNAPRIISLDEAFAGIDDQNIREMFRFMVQFDFNYMINSQILWGDYDTVPAMRIYQLIRPNNAKFVTAIPYLWNGRERVAEGIVESGDDEW